MNLLDRVKQMSFWNKLMLFVISIWLVALAFYALSHRSAAGTGTQVTESAVREEEAQLENLEAFSEESPKSEVSASVQAVKDKVFNLENCVYSAIFEVLPGKHAALGESGSIKVVMEFYKTQKPEEAARLSLSGRWQSDKGVFSKGLKDSVAYLEPERQFLLFRKEPRVERMPDSVKTLPCGEHYHMNISVYTEESQTAALLVPKRIDVITSSGAVHTITEFKGPRKGMWYSAVFLPQ